MCENDGEGLLRKGGVRKRKRSVIGEEKKSVECSPASQDPSPTTIYNTFVFFLLCCLFSLVTQKLGGGPNPYKPKTCIGCCGFFIIMNFFFGKLINIFFKDYHL